MNLRAAWSLCAILVVTGLITVPSFSASPDTRLTLTFVARGIEPKPSEVAAGDRHGGSLTGHIYMIMAVKTNTGVKEDLYGFYPVGAKPNSGPIDQVKAVIKGPGMLKAEYRCGPNDDCRPEKKAELLERLSESKASVTISITPEQRRQIFKTIEKWNGKEYRLADQNCEDFVGAVARDLGYPVPLRPKDQTIAELRYTQTPVEYLKTLQSLIQLEDRNRAAAAAEEKSRAAERAAQAAEQRRQQAEQAAQAADQRRQQTEQAAQAAEQRRQQAEQAREQAARATVQAGSCLDGSWREQYANPYRWNFKVSGDTLTIARVDNVLSSTLTHQGNNWTGTLNTNGRPGGAMILTPSSGCTKIETNQSWWYRR